MPFTVIHQYSDPVDIVLDYILEVRPYIYRLRKLIHVINAEGSQC